jgi:hypothetical protein
LLPRRALLLLTLLLSLLACRAAARDSRRTASVLSTAAGGAPDCKFVHMYVIRQLQFSVRVTASNMRRLVTVPV